MSRRANTFIRQLGGPSTGLGYGRLYNWNAVSNANFTPTDYKVPTQTEWNTLITTLGGGTVAGGSLKEVGFVHWASPNTGADNSSGFTSLGGGSRDGEDGSYLSLGEYGYYWTSTEFDSDLAYFSYQRYINTVSYSYYYSKRGGVSLRLLYTGVGSPTTVTDYDGNVYDVIQIGTQYWTKQNWKCTKLNDGTSIPEVTNAATWAGLTTGAWCYYSNDPNNL